MEYTSPRYASLCYASLCFCDRCVEGDGGVTTILEFFSSSYGYRFLSFFYHGSCMIILKLACISGLTLLWTCVL